MLINRVARVQARKTHHYLITYDMLIVLHLVMSPKILITFSRSVIGDPYPELRATQNGGSLHL